jgi:hypothetical protein
MPYGLQVHIELGSGTIASQRDTWRSCLSLMPSGSAASSARRITTTVPCQRAMQHDASTSKETYGAGGKYAASELGHELGPASVASALDQVSDSERLPCTALALTSAFSFVSLG